MTGWARNAGDPTLRAGAATCLPGALRLISPLQSVSGVPRHASGVRPLPGGAVTIRD